MVDKISSWKYTEDFHQEPEVIARARARADEMGIESITPSVGATLAVLVASMNAKAIVEVGTGAGVSGLWLQSGNSTSVLASIDTEMQHQDLAKLAFEQAGIVSTRLRMINGRSSEVLVNLADEAYDLVLLDGDIDSLLTQVKESLRLLRTGGVLAIPHALWRDRVPDQVLRDEITEEYRAVLEFINDSGLFIPALSTIGDGLLIASKK
ncbi:MAG: class I SAM-dependent methyltransferase [Rhodoluna sp.]|jgi:predicted O-methyltransferase YrrM|nr:class I SAM-dependent methyltransferase [Rhodoluna sp.]